MQLINVEYQRGRDIILKNINLNIKTEEIILVRGRSGVGKTTLAKITALILKPTKGSISFMNKSILGLPDRERSSMRLSYIGYIDQEYRLINEITVKENILLAAVLKGVDRGDALKKLYELSEKIGIKGLLDKYPGELSGGQRQRAVILRALIKDPILIIADEPYSSLDDETIRIVEELFREYINRRGSGVLITTTDLLGKYSVDKEFLLEKGTLRSM